MALSLEERRQLMALDLPEYDAAVKEVRDYMARTQLTSADIAMRIGYADSSIRNWLNGSYANVASHDTAIRAALMGYMTAHPIGATQHQQGKLHETRNTSLLLKYYSKALANGYAYYVHGDPGTQKTWVAEFFQQRVNIEEAKGNRRVHIVYSRGGHLRPLDLMKRVAEACGIAGLGNIDRIIRNLRHEFRGIRALLIFDEAQHLSVECLEVIRELYDRPPYTGLVFQGSHELHRNFIRHALTLEQWMSRFRQGKSLPGLDETEAWKIADDEIGDMLRAMFGKKEADAKLKKLVDGSRATVLRSQEKVQYFQARRLFNAINETREALAQRGGEA
ncbi:MAG TPA: ATP-binding protein [Terriglobales bacterium]|nr:ATP-binding protein [Clostridia bacterium]HWR17150.1 ATP-binding protein [Terriglobales bacterium]